MDAGNIIYIIAIVIYFIYSAVKKNKNNKELEGNEADEEVLSQPKKPTSFEDLLREIREGQQDREKDLKHTGQGKVATAPTPKVERMEPVRPDKKEFEPQRTIMRADQPVPKKFEDYEGAIPDREFPKVRKLDDKVSLSDPVEGMKSELFADTLKKAKPKNRYAELLKNPATVKDAVILSEILNRKYV